MNAFGQDAVDLGQLLLHPPDHRGGVRAVELDHHPGDDLLLAVASLEAPANRAADGDLRHVREKHGPTLFGLDDDRVQALDTRGEPHGSDHELLGILLDELRADVEVVLLDPLDHLPEREIVSKQRMWIDDDVILLHVPTDAEHLRHAGDRLEMELDDPVLDRAQLLQRIPAGRVVKVIEQHEAHAGGDRPHPGLAEALRNLLPRLLQPLVDELAREVDVQLVLEIDVDDRQAEVGHRSDRLDARQAVHRRLHRVGDEFLDLLGREPLGDREDLDKVRRDVREGVDRQASIAEPACADDQDGQDDQQETVSETELDQAFDHR